MRDGATTTIDAGEGRKEEIVVVVDSSSSSYQDERGGEGQKLVKLQKLLISFHRRSATDMVSLGVDWHLHFSPITRI